MKSIFKSVIAAFSMFSRIPMPQIEWSEGTTRYIMAAFPLVGVVLGGLMLAFLRLCDFWELSPVLRALGMTLLPLAVTGGIHLDGLCDTCDALGAAVSPERRREILKDPRAGAFGVIGVVTYLLGYFALALAVNFDGGYREFLYCLGFIVSRMLSADAILCFNPAPDGTGRTFHDAAAKKTSRAILVVFAALAGIAMYAAPVLMSPADSRADVKWNSWSLVASALWLFASALCYAVLRHTAKRKFEGMSGDLAGWFLQRCELWQLAALVAAGVIARRLGG
ncbi:MAG: adenosylcobinamide-GDP ribazoletransferase [Oscillospiraceae bacterium]|nr:adenosylcobinamide-GDP ribazoletransferase [Oscillospiraceae bacterium]